jgi:Domain of unknown function (DUF397)
VDLTRATWRKSSFSGNNGGNCVEITAATNEYVADGHLIAVRDSKDRLGPVLTFTSGDWQAFTHHVKSDRFNRP